MHEIKDPITDEHICSANQLIDEKIAKKIAETSIEEVEIRSVLTCETERGVCARCYGRDMGRNSLVEVGEAVGVIAAQSIGERRSEEHTSELQSRGHVVCCLLLARNNH